MGNTIRKIHVSRRLEQAFEEAVRRSRPRKPTLLKLQWLAERVRRCERIKKEIALGTYRVDSREVAKAILNIDSKMTKAANDDGYEL